MRALKGLGYVALFMALIFIGTAVTNLNRSIPVSKFNSLEDDYAMQMADLQRNIDISNRIAKSQRDILHKLNLNLQYRVNSLYGMADAHMRITSENISALKKHTHQTWTNPALKIFGERLITINTTANVKIKDEPDDASFEEVVHGLAIPLEDGYVLALTHVTEITNQLITYTPFGALSVDVEFVTMPIYEIKYHVKNSIAEDDATLPVELVGRYEDISLFRVVGQESPLPVNIPFGNSDYLVVAASVLSVGYSHNLMINYKDGIVSHLDPHFVTPLIIPFKNSFMFSAPGNPGDSGSLVVSFINGEPVIVGLIQGGMKNTQGMAFALKSNYVLDAIEKIKRVADQKRDFEQVRIK